MRNRNMYSEMETAWFGLNEPEISEVSSDVVVFGIPFDGSEGSRGAAAETPDLLRRNTMEASPCTEDLDFFDQLKVYDGGDFRGTDRETIYKEVEDYVASIVDMRKKFTMIGGDHSVSIPVMKGIDREISGSLGIINMGAYLDLRDDEDGDNLSSSTVMSRVLELESVAGPENIYNIGIRALNRQEFDKVKAGKFNVKTAKDCFASGAEAVAMDCVSKMKDFDRVYLTFNIDVLDPGYAAGTGMPQLGGLTPRMVFDMLSILFSRLNIIGFDMVEIAPALDDSLTAMYAGRRLVKQMWAHWASKLGKLEKLNDKE